MFTTISDSGVEKKYTTEREARASIPNGARGWKLLSPSGRGLKIRRGKQPQVKLPGECELCGGLKGMIGVLENDICDCDD